MRVSCSTIVLPLLLPLLLHGCTRPPAEPPILDTFEGQYDAAFETSSFQPCGRGEAWWVTFDTSSSLDRRVFPQLAALDDKPDSMLGHAVTVARFRGDTTPLGHYGHLGRYPRELHVTEVLELRRGTLVDCSAR